MHTAISILSLFKVSGAFVNAFVFLGGLSFPWKPTNMPSGKILQDANFSL